MATHTDTATTTAGTEITAVHIAQSSEKQVQNVKQDKITRKTNTQPTLHMCICMYICALCRVNLKREDKIEISCEMKENIKSNDDYVILFLLLKLKLSVQILLRILVGYLLAHKACPTKELQYKR